MQERGVIHCRILEEVNRGRIEGIVIKNFGSLKDITMERTREYQKAWYRDFRGDETIRNCRKVSYYDFVRDLSEEGIALGDI